MPNFIKGTCVMRDLILTTVASYIIPFIQLYGLYITFHGHDTPGGGFAGGVIIGVGFLLYFVVFSHEVEKFNFPDLAILSGLILFVTLIAEATIGHSFEIGIGIIVALVIIGIYYTMEKEV